MSNQSENFRVAVDYAKEAVDEIEREIDAVPFGFLNHGAPASLAGVDVFDIYFLYIDSLMQYSAEIEDSTLVARAVQAFESVLARQFRRVLSEADIDYRQGVDQSLLDQESNLRASFDAKAADRLKLGEDLNNVREAAEIDSDITRILERLKGVESLMRSSNRHYAALNDFATTSVEDIKNNVVDSQTIVLEYCLGEPRSYLWAITEDNVQSFELPSQSEIDDLVRRFHAALSNPSGDGAKLEETRAIGRRLRELLIDPARAELVGRRVVIVGNGALQYLPFAALPLDNDAGGAGFFGGVHEIITEPSASVLMLLKKRGDDERVDRSVMVLADPVFDPSDPRVSGFDNVLSAIPRSDDGSWLRSVLETGAPREGMRLPRLPFSRREAKRIHGLSDSDQSVMLLDFDARLSQLADSALDRQYLHFATHAVLNAEHPALSGIVLSLVDEDGKPVDGFLKLEDIYRLRMRARLVVLSACQTGLGSDVKGEGLVGLTRGFLHAGANSVIASLWKVDDLATAEFMEEFYTGLLRDGLSPSAALQRAQSAMRRHPRWSSPYYWAAFSLQGDWRK